MGSLDSEWQASSSYKAQVLRLQSQHSFFSSCVLRQGAYLVRGFNCLLIDVPINFISYFEFLHFTSYFHYHSSNIIPWNGRRRGVRVLEVTEHPFKINWIESSSLDLNEHLIITYSRNWDIGFELKYLFG
uniref:Uncharacterized protein n=1 Tax=Opuntia streptacantha TaxID=393608 RepID=A0A7C9AUQ1_OPUST